MSAHGFHILLEPIWREWDDHVFRLVERLHRGLPRTVPVVTLHGRQLEPGHEAVGAQYQLTMNGRLYGGRYQAAYFVIQIQLLRQAPPPPLRGPDAKATVVWRVDTLPVLQRPSGQIDQFSRQTHEIPMAETERFDALFDAPLGETAADFFRRALAGQPIEGQ